MKWKEFEAKYSKELYGKVLGSYAKKTTVSMAISSATIATNERAGTVSHAMA